MKKTDQLYITYLDILKKELIPAMGCTEPIAIAYGAAYARRVLGSLPDTVSVKVSGNLLKNVKSVLVPNTGGMKGVEVSVAIGIIAGEPDKKLEVISEVSDVQREAMRAFLRSHKIEVALSTSDLAFDYSIILRKGDDEVCVRIVNYHTNVICVTRNQEILLNKDIQMNLQNEKDDKRNLNIETIIDFADSVDVKDVQDVLERQIKYNSDIAQEGMTKAYGASIGRILMKTDQENIAVKAKALAAAGSDARMNGSEMPVVIVSGSGNQGITSSVPVIEYARAIGCSQDKLYRALVVSNLTTIHQKTGIGYLSAFCGVISAGAGSGAGICYLLGGGYEKITQTIMNTLAISSGVVCDGAKSSCAAKIALAVDAGVMGCNMCMSGKNFSPGDGIVSRDVETTIENVAKIGRDGMSSTDKEIIKIMLDLEE